VDRNHFVQTAKNIYRELNARTPPDDGVRAETHQVLSPAVVRGTRGYLEMVSNQINGSFEKGWYDAAAVMMRRLLETVIIEAFEERGINERIMSKDGNYVYLRDLIAAALNEKTWTLTRNTRTSLPRLKALGDLSAHSRRYVAHRQDIEKVVDHFRCCIQEFIYLASLK
jgi:hypothetical protein